MDDPPDLVDTLIGMANVAYDQGDLARAVTLCEECLEVARRVSDQRSIAAAVLRMGHVARAQYEGADALTLYREALYLHQRVGSMRGIVCVLEAIAVVQCAQRHLRHATRLLGAASAFRAILGVPVAPVDRPLLEQARTACVAALGDDVFAATWAEGTAMTQQQAIAQAASSPTEEEETLLAFATRAAKALQVELGT